MGQKINTLKPDKPIPGAAITKSSIAGRKTQFVLQTTQASASFTLSAGAIHYITMSVDLWAEDLPVNARNTTNIVPPSQCIVWTTIDAWIDNNNNGAYYIGTGSSVAGTDLALITLAHFDETTPTIYSGSTTDSSSTQYCFNSFSVSSHMIYVTVTAKYLIFGDSNL